MINLDCLAARYGNEIGINPDIKTTKLDTIITSALNILHGQGIYAMFLWLKENNERNIVIIKLDKMFHDNDSPISVTVDLSNMNNVRECLTNNIKTMFLAKDLIDLTLTYARHTAKANA